MAAKRLYTTFWQPSALKADASFPLQEDITIGAGYLDCKDLDIVSLRTVLTGPNLKLIDLCNLLGSFIPGGEAGKVNVWARYKPGQTAYSILGMLPSDCTEDPSFTYTTPAEGGSKIDSFAGYNHSETSRPVWWASPHPGPYIFFGPLEIKGGLQRGKLCPLLGGPEDETLWSRVKVQAWLRINSGAYSLIETSDFVDLSEPYGDLSTLFFTLGEHGETIGNNYTLCLRPVYMDEDGITPLAVCEGGVNIFTYRKWGTLEDIAAALSITLNEVDTQEPSGGHPTTFTYDFNLNNDSPNAIGLAVRLHAYDNDDWFDQTYPLTSSVVIPENDSYNFNNTVGENLPATLYNGTFSLAVEISVDAGETWLHVGYLGTELQHWQSIP